jgi:Lrp/AsnC family transcriptional regulator for asnA, asnC and gidA
MTIDKIDKIILEMLQKDARIAFRRIAESSGVSEATIFLRIKKLQEKGIIKRFTAIVSPELVGKKLIAFILINTDPKKLQYVLDKLSRMEDIYEIYDVTGTYYIVAKIITQDKEILAKTIDQVGLIEGITRTETSIVLRTIKEENRINL